MDIKKLESSRREYLTAKAKLELKLSVIDHPEIYRIYIQSGWGARFVLDLANGGSFVFTIERGRTVIGWKYGITSVEAYLVLAKLFNNQNNTI